MAKQARPRTPKLRLHKATGKGRVILSGRHFYTLAPFDSPEAQQEYLEIVQAWEENGCVPFKEPADGTPATVGELRDAYHAHLDAIGLFRKEGKPTSQRGLIEKALLLLVGDWTGGVRSGSGYQTCSAVRLL